MLQSRPGAPTSPPVHHPKWCAASRGASRWSSDRSVVGDSKGPCPAAGSRSWVPAPETSFTPPRTERCAWSPSFFSEEEGPPTHGVQLIQWRACDLIWQPTPDVGCRVIIRFQNGNSSFLDSEEFDYCVHICSGICLLLLILGRPSLYPDPAPTCNSG